MAQEIKYGQKIASSLCACFAAVAGATAGLFFVPGGALIYGILGAGMLIADIADDVKKNERKENAGFAGCMMLLAAAPFIIGHVTGMDPMSVSNVIGVVAGGGMGVGLWADSDQTRKIWAAEPKTRAPL